jgi:hypothetical protein
MRAIMPPKLQLIQSEASVAASPPALRTRGATWAQLGVFAEARGTLIVGQSGDHLPFAPQRWWFVFGVPEDRSRGGHAHYGLHEAFVCQRGSCKVTIDDGENREEILLDRPDLALCVAPLTWSVQREFSSDALLLVLGSEIYRPDDYIRDYDLFLALCSGRAG